MDFRGFRRLLQHIAGKSSYIGDHGISAPDPGGNAGKSVINDAQRDSCLMTRIAFPICGADAMSKTSVSAAQFVEQRLSLFQIVGVKAFGEPVVDVVQKLLSL